MPESTETVASTMETSETSDGTGVKINTTLRKWIDGDTRRRVRISLLPMVISAVSTVAYDIDELLDELCLCLEVSEWLAFLRADMTTNSADHNRVVLVTPRGTFSCVPLGAVNYLAEQAGLIAEGEDFVKL